MLKKKRSNSFYQPFFDEFGIEEEDHNAWAISYGDMVSVLLAFFIILISFSTISPEKFESMKKNIKATKERTSIQKLNENIEKIIREKKLEKYLQISKNSLGSDINIRDEILFGSGSAGISKANVFIIEEIIGSFKSLPEGFKFEIEGHTDDIPIKNEEYPSNWYLSTARALSILEIFLKQGFTPDRLQVQGFADTNPLKPLRDKQGNPIDENRTLNRRVLIKVR